MLQEDQPAKVEQTNLDLYLGSLSRQVKLLKTVPSSKFIYNGSNLKDIKNAQSIRSALSYRFKQSFINPSKYPNLYIPCTPAIEITELDHQSAGVVDEEHIVQHGFVKVNGDAFKDYELLDGYQSGKRSAVVKLGDRTYRLKGCGNLDQGFPLQGDVTEDPSSQEIRGCHFYHTVKRELLITRYVEEMLTSHGIQCGNRSVGFYQMDVSPFLSKLQDACPEVPKYCGVFETLSDKRVGTHLLQGLQLQLLIALSLNEKPIHAEQLKSYIDQPSRIAQFTYEKEVGKWHLSTTYFELSEKPDNLYQDPKANLAAEKLFDPQKESMNIDTLHSLNDSSRQLFSIQPIQEQTLGYLKNLLWRLNVHKDYHGQFLEQQHMLQSFSSDLLASFFLIYGRLGYEIGRIKRIFIDNDFNWGYYRDHHRGLYHCNAHVNNFVVLPPGHPNLLACIDFDLAFRKHEFISIEYDFDFEIQCNKIEKYVKENKPIDFELQGTSVYFVKAKDPRMAENYGKFDLEEWNWYIQAERQSLEMGLAGIEIIMNSIMQELDLSVLYHQNDQSFFSPEAKELQEILDVLLRDQMRIGYLQGMHLKEWEYQGQYDQHRQVIRCLIESALILSSDVVA